MDIKYLSDGRKVTVLGRLNNQEMIVQEIFVDTQGNEIPSGESFTAKSLHDTPVLSWQEKHAKETEAKINKIKEDIKKCEKLYDEKHEKLKSISNILESTENFVKNLKENEIKVMSQFVTGTIEYLVIDSYGIDPPIKMIDAIAYFENNYESLTYEGLKLFSVFGGSKGKFTYKIHEYSDGSGGRKTIYPFTNREDAIELLKQKAIKMIEENKLGQDSYKACMDMGIVFSDEQKKQYQLKIEKNIKKSIKCDLERKKEIEKKIQKSLEELKKIAVG